MKKLLTIIIPTYNMELYLRKCLQSLVISKSLQETLEVIVINDGSKDSSLAIAQEYEMLFPNVYKVIDKENGNYGSCINEGLKHATGRFVKILDADDTLDNNSLETYLHLISEANVDLIVSNYNVVDDNNKVVQQRNFNLSPGAVLKLSDCDNIVMSGIQMHALAYRREMLQELSYQQTSGISYTDQEWCFIPMSGVSTFLFCKISLYNYWVGRTGQTMDPAKMLQSISHLEIVGWRLLDFYNSNKWNIWLDAYYRERLLMHISQIYRVKLLYSNFRKDNYLDRIDRILFEKNSSIYEELNGIVFSDKYCQFHYIRNWRERKYTLINIAVYVFKVQKYIQYVLRKFVMLKV